MECHSRVWFTRLNCHFSRSLSEAYFSGLDIDPNEVGDFGGQGAGAIGGYFTTFTRDPETNSLHPKMVFFFLGISESPFLGGPQFSGAFAVSFLGSVN